ncbi:MoaD/ThiS family protein [Streptomyces sp. NPDC051940]|uniref:MoaD/ThiS family protein n=1 Tax=Streptomyces sp. NPDC051940 TaxID=3155675 RepID=UPI0034194F32
MQFQFSGFLLRYVDYQRTLDYDAGTVGDALSQLFDEHPGLRPVVVDEAGGVRRTVRLCLDGELLPASRAHEVELTGDSRVDVLTAVAGG